MRHSDLYDMKHWLHFFLPWVRRERFSSSRPGWQGVLQRMGSIGSPRNAKNCRRRLSWSSGDDSKMREGPISSNSTYSWRKKLRSITHSFSKIHTPWLLRQVPVCPGPRSPLLTDPWLCRASRGASVLPPEMTPHPTRLCVWADYSPSPPPRLPLLLLLPLWKHTDH